jgi:hypothetical protein
MRMRVRRRKKKEMRVLFKELETFLLFPLSSGLPADEMMGFGRENQMEVGMRCSLSESEERLVENHPQASLLKEQMRILHGR